MSNFIEIHDPKVREPKQLLNTDQVMRVTEGFSDGTTDIYMVDGTVVHCNLTYRTMKGRLGAGSIKHINNTDTENQNNSESEGV